MTKDEALGKLSHLYSQADSMFLVNALEALGLLKFDECKDACHPTHKTRISDASSFDEICVVCGATDVAGGGWGNLRYPCSAPAPPQQEGE